MTVDNFPKLQIKKVSNGYIVTVIITGQSAYTDPYTKPVMVFQEQSDMQEWLATFFTEKKK